MAEADRLTIAGGVPGITLMEAAGAAIADAVAARHPVGSRVAVLVQPGQQWWRRLRRRAAARAARLQRATDVRRRGCALEKAMRQPPWRSGRGRSLRDSQIGFANARVIIDALFGAGLDRPVEGQARAMIEAMNAQSAPILAVDLPSGINGSTGELMGAAVNATQSITFFRKKVGHVLLPGRLHCGRVSVADIGIPANVLAELGVQTFENTPQLWRGLFPHAQAGGHKYDRGHAVVVSGPLWSTGAARLAARAALRAGAGLVTIASPRDALSVNAAANLAVMVRPVDGTSELAEFLTDRRLNTVALGPGLGVGASTCEAVLTALSGERAVSSSMLTPSQALRRSRGAWRKRLRAPRRQAHRHDTTRGRISSLFRGPWTKKRPSSRLQARESAACGNACERDRCAQGCGYRGCRTGRACCHRRQRAALSCDRRRRRRAHRNGSRAPGARDAGIRGRGRRRLVPRRSRACCGARKLDFRRICPKCSQKFTAISCLERRTSEARASAAIFIVSGGRRVL